MARQTKKQTKEETPVISTSDIVGSYLKGNLKDKSGRQRHFSFEEQVEYYVSSGSLTLDIEMGGGIRPGVIRSTGVMEGGKTSSALAFARNFQKLHPENCVVYVKSEGRLLKEVMDRAGLNTDKKQWLEIVTNEYEFVIGMINRILSEKNDNGHIMFVIDSLDGLKPKAELEKFVSNDKEGGTQKAGSAALTSDFLAKMALPIATKGNILYVISQVRANFTVKAYQKQDYRPTNASGGNAIQHYCDWILEFQPRKKWDEDNIFTVANPTPSKDEPIGHYCILIFRKSVNEKTGTKVRYPIKHGRKNGKSVWVEKEILGLLLSHDFVARKSSWFSFTEDAIAELKQNGLIEEDKLQFQGENALFAFLEDNRKIIDFYFEKFTDILKREE